MARQSYYFKCAHSKCDAYADCPIAPSLAPECNKRTVAGEHGPMDFIREKSTGDWAPKEWDKKRNPWDPTTW